MSLQEGIPFGLLAGTACAVTAFELRLCNIKVGHSIGIGLAAGATLSIAAIQCQWFKGTGSTKQFGEQWFILGATVAGAVGGGIVGAWMRRH